MLGAYIQNAQCTGDNQVLLGNTAVSQIRAQTTSITSYSDGRYKKNIENNISGLEFITRLNPVSYNVDPEELHRIWGTPDSIVKKMDHSQVKTVRYSGFIAQEVEQAMKESGYEFTGIDIPKNDQEVYALRYTEFIMPMVKAIQEQQIIIEEQKTKLASMNAEQADMNSKIEELEKLILEMSSRLESNK